MNMPLIVRQLKQYSRLNPRWTQQKINSLAKKYGQTDSKTEEIDNHIMENNLQELLLMDEAEIIKNLKSNKT